MDTAVTGTVSNIPKDPGFISLPPSGLEGPLTDTQTQILDTVRRFAKEVMRPIGIELDRMTPEEAIAKGSPLWTFFAKFQELGLTVSTFAEFPRKRWAFCSPLCGRNWAMAMAAWRSLWRFSCCRTCSWRTGAVRTSSPRFLRAASAAGASPSRTTVRTFSTRTATRTIRAARRASPTCSATFKGDKIILNGQKSAWVSNGTIAQHALLYTACDRGNGPNESIVLVCPLDGVKGVSKGKPLDKIGQRPLNQGEIYFNNVEISQDWIIAQPEQYKDAVHAILAEANSIMGCVWTGAARASYELARDYVHVRKQGGAPIHQHQNVKYRLLHMFRQVEVARAMARRAYLYNHTAPAPALHGSICAKVTATQAAFDVASMAIQMFGGNGLTREYPVEKTVARRACFDDRGWLQRDACDQGRRAPDRS